MVISEERLVLKMKVIFNIRRFSTGAVRLSSEKGEKADDHAILPSRSHAALPLSLAPT
jgi:hypothetical protein